VTEAFILFESVALFIAMFVWAYRVQAREYEEEDAFLVFFAYFFIAITPIVNAAYATAWVVRRLRAPKAAS
jgi:hypothetical protein